MMQLAMEIKGQDHATAAANLEGAGDDTHRKRSNNAITAAAASGKKSSKGGSLLQRFRLNSVLSSGSSGDDHKNGKESGSTEEYHVSSGESEQDELSEMMGNHVNVQIYN